jgi:hypothetical protein
VKSNFPIRAVSLLILASAALTAQVARQGNNNVVPLTNWAAPLYWQPNQAERAAATKATPQLMFSSNAISTNALTFVAISPCRLMDTRGLAANFGTGGNPATGPGTGSFAPGQIPSQGTLTIDVQSAAEQAISAPAPCGAIPSIAQAYSFNLTVVPAGATASSPGGAVDYVTIWPAGSAQPFVSTLDDPQGLIESNAAIVPAGTPYGGVSVYNHGQSATDVIIDMNGYFAAPTDLSSNTAIGFATLASNDGGASNTAVGAQALQDNTSGSDNTATGVGALQNNNGSLNTANGVSALGSNTSGASNTASGFQALQKNSSGSDNTASGVGALENNTTGASNTANGSGALVANTGGSSNTASGQSALAANTTGGNNTASGQLALSSNTSGSNNIAIGYDAASSVSGANSNNIHIGSLGLSADGAGATGVIRIGTVGTQSSTYIAGIYGATPGSSNLLVCVDANGTLGTSGCTGTPSSRRFKEQISDMGDSSSKLFQLRPVTFFYKPEYDDGSHTLQYGLIAEEVAKLYPDMAGYDKDGQPSSVKYQSLTPMLLNEVQKQNTQLQLQQEENRKLEEENRKLEERLAALEALLSQTPAAARPAGSQ